MAGIEDIIAEAASATTQMTPDRKEPLTSMQPAPLSMPTPIPRMAINQPIFGQAGNSFQSSGERKRADRQALISNTVQMVKSGADYIQQRKDRNLQMDLERLFGAQEGLQEAQANGDQAAIKRNTDIMNTILTDPKKVKMIQKALNIDLTGTGKNKNENQALQEAWKNYNTEKQKGNTALNPIAQRLVQSQPMRQQLSPEAQAQAAAIKAGLLPQANEVLKAGYENLRTFQQADSADKRDAVLEKAAQLRADAERFHAQSIYDAALQRYLGTKLAAEIRERTVKYVADSVSKDWDKRLAELDKITGMRIGQNPLFKQLYGEANTTNTELKNLYQERQKLEAELDKASPSAVGKWFGMRMADNMETRRMKDDLFVNTIKIKQAQAGLDAVKQKMQALDAVSGGGLTDILNDKGNPATGLAGSGNIIDVPDTDMGDDQ